MSYVIYSCPKSLETLQIKDNLSHGVIDKEVRHVSVYVEL